MSSSVAATGNVVLHLSRDEADAVVEGLHMLLNCKRFAFKEPHEDVRQLHAPLYEMVERIEAEVAASGPKRGSQSNDS